jgi:hypothetical protein
VPAFFVARKNAKIRIMKRCCAVLFVIASASICGAAQKRMPTFSQYPSKLERLRISKIDFRKYPDARTYRSRLTDGLKRGINFAGHFVIVGWGCGTGCTNAAVIDGRSGKLMWPEEFMNVDASYGDGYSDVQLDFRRNSRLLVIHGRPGTADESGSAEPAGDHYFLWNGSAFRKIASVKKDSN